MGKGDSGRIADVEPLRAVDDFAFDGRVEDPDKGAFGRGPGDDALELVPDLAGKGDGRDPLLHGPLDLAGGGIALVEVSGDLAEFVVGVGRWAVGEGGQQDALGDEIGKAAVGGGGMGVIEGGKAEVAGLLVFCAMGAAGCEDVLAGAHELDDGE